MDHPIPMREKVVVTDKNMMKKSYNEYENAKLNIFYFTLKSNANG
jgi:hypothetical protein